jgi:carbon-monoxide dehydrogenase iron sulfur subunit
VCPTGAIFRDAQHDLVLIHPAKCIACAMCAMVCPFDVLTYHAWGNGMPARVIALKCDGCVDRVRRGEVPACVEVCKVGALVYGELNELVKAGRLRDAHVVLTAAAAAEPAAPAVPETIGGWRAWGAEATHVAEGGAR